MAPRDFLISIARIFAIATCDSARSTLITWFTTRGMQFSVRRVPEARAVYAESQGRVRVVLQELPEDHARDRQSQPYHRQPGIPQVPMLVSQRKQFQDRALSCCAVCRSEHGVNIRISPPAIVRYYILYQRLEFTRWMKLILYFIGIRTSL